MFQTRAEVVAIVKMRFEKTDKLSKSPTGGCYYHHEYNGVGCAVGCLLPTHQVGHLTEGDTPSAFLTDDDNPLWQLFVIPSDEFPSRSAVAEFLERLQQLHDSAEDYDHFMRRLEEWKSGYMPTYIDPHGEGEQDED